MLGNSRAYRSPVSFKNVQTKNDTRETASILTIGQIDFLFCIVRRALAGEFGIETGDAIEDPGGWSAGFINVTLRAQGRLLGSMGSHGASLVDAARSAVVRASRDKRFGIPPISVDFGMLTIEVWIEIGRVDFSGDCSTWEEQFRPGREGVRISQGTLSAYYKPSVAITSRLSTLDALLSKLSRKAKLEQTAWQSPGARVERTQWIHAVETASGVTQLEGLRPRSSGLPSRDGTVYAATLAVRRLLAIQQSDGMLRYCYSPFDDKWIEKNNYVRQAGCAYALARLAKFVPALGEESAINEAAGRLLNALLLRTGRYGSGNLLYVTEPDSMLHGGKLGSTALTALATQYTADNTQARASAEFIRTIVSLQQPDGSFECGIGREVRESSQEFFPGEALCALAAYTRRTADEKAAIAVARAFPFYRAHFRARPTSAFVLWQATAWTEIATGLSENSLPAVISNLFNLDELCQFVFEQVDWLLKFQYTPGRTSLPEYWGGFTVAAKPSLPTCSSAVYTEGVIRALDAATILRDGERIERYRTAALSGLQFIQSLQVKPEMAPFFPRPEFAVGAITKTLSDFEMRCDNDQHLLTACMTALECRILWQ
jgi:AMMECR1 domain-containing protein